MKSLYWEQLEERLYQSAAYTGANPDKAGAIVDRRLSKKYDQYERIAQGLIAKGYTRVPDLNNFDFPDWFISPKKDMNHLAITEHNGGYMAVTSGPLPGWIAEKA